MARTFYDVLDVEEDAESEEIRRTYRTKAKEHHPDVSDDPDAGERFKRINRAAEVLGDPAERKRYDRLGHETYVAMEGSHDGPGADAGTSEDIQSGSAATDGSGSTTTTAGAGGRGTTVGGTDGGATAGATGPGTANGPGTGATGPWGPDPEDRGPQAGTTTGGTGEKGATNSATANGSAGETDGPWTGFRDADGPGAASSGGSIGRGSARSDPEQTARWEYAHDPDPTGRDGSKDAWRETERPARRNAWLVTLSMVGSGQVVDQWTAFRRGLLLVYLYPMLLALLLAQVSPPVTIVAAMLTVFVAVYGSGIPNVGTLVFGLLGGLVTVFLVQSPYSMASPTARVVLAACWVPLGHSLVVAWLLHRSSV